jgi:hypothetical protein
MTNYPPGGNVPPDRDQGYGAPQDPGYGTQGPGYGGPQGPGYGPPQGPGSGAPQDPGYGPPQGPGYGQPGPSGPGYNPPGPGYGPAGPGGPGYDPSQGGPGYDPAQGGAPTQDPGQPTQWDQGYRQEQSQYYQQPGYAVEPAQNYGVTPYGSDHPVQVTVAYPEQSSRVLAGFSILPYFLLRMIMLIPALFVLYFVSIAALVVAWIACWAVLFTGRFPPTFHSFITGYVRWTTRCTCFWLGLTDKYPPFRLDP